MFSVRSSLDVLKLYFPLFKYILVSFPPYKTKAKSDPVFLIYIPYKNKN